MGIEGRLLMKEKFIEEPKVQKYITEKVLTDIDLGSEFDKKNRKLVQKISSPITLLEQLHSQGYDVLLTYNTDSIVGHIAYQEHEESNGKNWQMFRMRIQDEFRSQGYALPFVETFIEKARKYGVSKVRLGQGGHKSMKKLLRILKRREDKLHIVVDQESHWVMV